MTDRRGVGVYTKKALKEGDILGRYASEVLPRSTAEDTGYNLEADIGIVMCNDSDSDPVEAVIIDANRKGNWTRFISHSCRPLCTFGMARAGDVRVEVVRACEDIPADVELTIGYGSK
jgi:SET domain-containing protein